jgi:hypothetical protein
MQNVESENPKNKLQMFVNQGLSIIMAIRWPNIISNTAEVLEATRQKSIIL